MLLCGAACRIMSIHRTPPASFVGALAQGMNDDDAGIYQ
jgi:hypothetical protein